MDSNQLTIFKNDTIGEIKGFIDEKTGEPWFLAGKVCDCLKIKNSADAIKGIKERHLQYGDKIDGIGISYIVTKDTLGRKTKSVIINEKILYELIFRSNTKKAFLFQQWVFGEVLPSLRKHGEYRMQGKLIRRTLTDTIKTEVVPKIESEKGKKFIYSTYSRMINKSLGLPYKVDRNSLDDLTLEKIARKENLVSAMIQDGKVYQQIRDYIFGGDL